MPHIKSKRMCAGVDNLLETKLTVKREDLEKSVVVRMIPVGKFLYTITISVKEIIKRNREKRKYVSLFVKCTDADERPDSNKWQTYIVLRAIVESLNFSNIRNEFFVFYNESPEHGWSDFVAFDDIRSQVESEMITFIIGMIEMPSKRTPLTLKALCGNKIIELLGKTDHAVSIPTLQLPRVLEYYLTLESNDKLKEKVEVKKIKLFDFNDDED